MERLNLNKLDLIKQRILKRWGKYMEYRRGMYVADRMIEVMKTFTDLSMTKCDLNDANLERQEKPYYDIQADVTSVTVVGDDGITTLYGV